MLVILQILGILVLSAVVAYGLTAAGLLFRKKVTEQSLLPGSAVRLKTPSGVYRTRFIGPSAEGMSFAAPLQRDHYVPIGVGELVTVESPMKNGVAIFRTRVVARDADTHEILLAKPEKIYREDRRSASRRRSEMEQIRVEDAPAWLCDLGPAGIRFRCETTIKKGERIKVELPDRNEPSYAWVLDCSGNQSRFARSHLVRARFEEPVEFCRS
jgi:hypothetical protein